MVELCDATALNPDVLDAAQNEARLVYERAGIDLLWTDGCPTVPVGAESHLARIYIVRELPKSVLYRLQHFKKKTHLMGYVTPHPGGGAGAIIYVSRAGVEANASRHGAVDLTPECFARALGRVMAHELAHRFLQFGHTRKGILKNRFDHQDLVGTEARSLFFDERQQERLRRVAMDPSATSSPSAGRGTAISDLAGRTR